MRRVPATITTAFLIWTLLIPAALPAAAAGSIASLQATVDTGSWAPPSPDPTGVAWWGAKGRLIVVDSEVEETVAGITHYEGANTWEVSTSGDVLGTSTTVPFSIEPTDVAADGSTVYISDDNADRVFVIDIGPDGELGSADDTRTSFSTRDFDSYDPEGIALGDGSLFVADGVGSQVFRIDSASDGSFDGVSDGVACFDTTFLGMRDPEGITMDPATGRLYFASRRDRQIAVSTAEGTLVDLIDVSNVLPYDSEEVSPAGIAVAPASADPSQDSLYVVDRGVDNNVDPNAVDGRLYEIGLSPPTSNVRPVLAAPGRQPVVEGESVKVRIVAADPNQDALSYAATGLPGGLSIDEGTGVITGTIEAGAAGPGGFLTYGSTVSVSDGSLTTSRTVNWDVGNGAIVNNAPTLTSPGDQTSTEGASVDLPVVASDPDAGNVLMHSATGLPPGLWMDCFSGVISGTIAPGAAAGSPYTVQISVSDQVVPAEGTFPRKWDAVTVTWTVAAAGGGGGGVGGGGGAPSPASPTIASFSPTSGPVGSTVTIDGTGFTGTTSVGFGGTVAESFTVESPTRITAVVPPGAATGPITVANADGIGTSAAEFTVVSAVHRRTITLNLRRHLVARGKVSAADGSAGCVQEVTVRIQRRSSGGWRTIEVTVTNAKGVYRERIPDRPGRYRVVARKLIEGSDVCMRARSPVAVNA